VVASTRREWQIPNRRKTNFLPRRILTPSVLWRLLCTRGRGAQNSFGNNSFDDRYRNKKNARLGCPRRGRSDTQDCHARRRVTTCLNSPLHCFKDKKALTEEESPSASYTPASTRRHPTAPPTASRDYSQPWKTKRIKLSLHAVSKAQAAQTFKQLTPGKGDESNPDKPTP
jgi:hypothetical protein